MRRESRQGAAHGAQLRRHPGAVECTEGTVGLTGALAKRRDLVAFADEVGADGPVAVEGSRTRWSAGGEAAPGVRLVRAPSGVADYLPEEMVVCVGAGTTVAELASVLASRGQRCALPERGGTVGGAIAVGEQHLDVLARGSLRASVLEVRYVSSEGRLVRGG
ncbi:MAG: FAD-binding protein, partial [Actinobacteria bacterium]|nr:FAD-binding protein [Actinomycetota bacterium]